MCTIRTSSNYRGLSSKTPLVHKPKKTKQTKKQYSVTRTVTEENVVIDTSSSDEETPNNKTAKTVFSILKQKIDRSTEDINKRKQKMAKLLEEQVDTSEESEEETRNKTKKGQFAKVKDGDKFWSR